MKVVVNQVYTAVGCNRTPEIVDWNKEGLICFGATNAVVINDTNEKCRDPITVLSHHRSVVKTVKWLYKPDGSSTELVSGSADKSAAIWSLVDGMWKVTGTLTGHTDGVTTVHGIYNGDKLIVYTGSIDCTIRVWQRLDNTSTPELFGTIQLNNGLCLTMCAHLMPLVGKPILFCGLDDHKIHVFTGDEYHRVHTMPGHEDWVRGLDVLQTDESTLLVASASQDTYIRLWRISPRVDGLTPTGVITVEKILFTGFDRQWTVKLEAVLAGHEGWVYGVQWYPGPVEGGKRKPVYRLLSSSLDKTLVVWEPDEGESGGTGGTEGGVWRERLRLGEVGGSGLGFYGGRFGPNGELLAHGYNGSFHVWTYCQESSQWKPSVVGGGHFGSVEDVRWEPHRGRYLVSVSADQTTRVHAPWNRPDGLVEWHEVSRPQVHGYGLTAVAPFTARLMASAADEKVIRVFTAPNNFHYNFESITGQVLVEGNTYGPEGAAVPSLGLSNKAVFSGDDNKISEDKNDGYFVAVHMKEPPTEETLMQNTLWPEHQKLYGHGFEVHALCAAGDGTLLASSCRATHTDHAAVLLWETRSWTQIQRLVFHSLTVTALEFSSDSRRLLATSRDRRWSLYKRRAGANLFDLEASTDRTNGVHARIIWCCAWTHDGVFFATGSRDGKVCVWTKTDIAPMAATSSLGPYALHGKALELCESSVTALAFAPLQLEAARLVAVGLESGVVRLYCFDGLWSLVHVCDSSAAHHLAVKRLTFKPQKADARHQQALLASAGADTLVRLHCLSVL